MATGDPTAAGRLTVVVVHRRRAASAVRTIAELRAQWPELRVIVVDNGSPADDRRVLAGIDGIEIVELPVNIGFGPAANVGLRRWLDGGEGEWCLVCPHDARPEPDCVHRLVTGFAARPGAGLAGAEYAEAGNFGGPGRDVKPALHPWIGTYLVPRRASDGWEDAAYPHGTLMLLGRACLEDIGVFDERYFAYSEEADLAVRAKRAGWGVGIVWGAVVRNLETTSEPGVPEYLMQRNTLMLVRDHFGRRAAAVLFLLTVWTSTVAAVVPSRRPPFWHRTARWLAMWDFLRGRHGPPNARLTG